jgi:integrase
LLAIYLIVNDSISQLPANNSLGNRYCLVLLAMVTEMRRAERGNLRWSAIGFNRLVAMLATIKNGELRHWQIPFIDTGQKVEEHEGEL